MEKQSKYGVNNSVFARDCLLVLTRQAKKGDDSITREKLEELVQSGEYKRIGPSRLTGYIRKGDEIVSPYIGRYGVGWMVESHINGNYKRHNVDYYVRI